jgi:hypothetical protein
MDYEMTVRGSLHWVRVMKEWNWDGMLVADLFSIILG